MSPAAASFRHVSKFFGSHQALKELSFEIPKGKLTAFLGPNGAGKSTTIKILLGLDQASSGEVRLLGSTPTELPIRERLGYTSQDLNYPPHLKVYEILSWIAHHYPSPHDLNQIKENFHLSHLWKRQVGQLSGGERRMVGLASAFLGRPEVLILDEPTTALDIDAKEILWSQLRKFTQNGGTILLCTHDLDEVSKVADHVLLIEKGQLLFSGPLEEAIRSIDYHAISYFVDRDQQHHLVKDGDAFVRELVEKRVNFSQLSISRASLEDAFQKLRGRMP